MAFGIDLGDVNRRLDNTETHMADISLSLQEITLLLSIQNDILREILKQGNTP